MAAENESQPQPFPVRRVYRRTDSGGSRNFQRTLAKELGKSEADKEAQLVNIMQKIVSEADVAIKHHHDVLPKIAEMVSNDVVKAENSRVDGKVIINLSVKEWNSRGVEAEAQAILEVLDDFNLKVPKETRSENSIIAHAYIMCRIDEGFHCFGLYVEKNIAVAGSKTNLVVFGPSHGPYVRTQSYRVETMKYLSAKPGFVDQYDPYCMVPLWYFQPDMTASSSYFGIMPHNQMAPVKKVVAQLALHRGHECGMLSYFAMMFFMTVQAQFSKPLFDCLNIRPVDFVHITSSVWDSRDVRPSATNNTLQSETIPASLMTAEVAERFTNREQFMFKALAFPKALELISEYLPLGEIFADGVNGQLQNQPWIIDLKKAGLLPAAGDSEFRKHSYLSMFWPSASNSLRARV